MDNINLLWKRKQWFIPVWENLEYGTVPQRLPQSKTDICAIVRVDTSFRNRRKTMVQVVYDLMRRLARDIESSGAPVDASFDGRAWLFIYDGVPLGCATVCHEDDKHKLLGAWVVPEARRKRIMTALWNEITKAYGNIEIVRPSPMMQQWMSKTILQPLLPVT